MTATRTSKSGLNQLIRDASRYLRRAGIDSPFVDVEIMLMHILNCRRVDLYLGDREITDEQKGIFKDYLAHRAGRMPVQYITGIANFMGFDLQVKPGVFIPRPETELLVEEILTTVQGSGVRVQDWKILDLCTGSGCIAISLARLIPNCEIAATDISEIALEVAEENAEVHGVRDKITFLQGDLFDALAPLADVKFDIIASNPPYIKTADIAALSPEVQTEPRIALDGGEDGMRFYNRIYDSYKKYILSPSRLFLEKIN